MLDINRIPDASVRTRAVGATWASGGLHAAIALLLGLVVGQKSFDDGALSQVRAAPPLAVWLDGLGRIEGGGDRGDRSPTAAPRAERVGTAHATVPTLVAASLSRAVHREPPLQQIDIPAVPEASGLREIAGDLATVSIGVWTGGPRSGRGSGNGDGDGLDAGFGGNTGGGPRGAGSPGSSPQLIRSVRPNYTSSALQARIQGLVVMDAVVLPDGSVGDVKIVRSLDRTFGLDEEAIKAVKQWRFRAGTRAGHAIPMLVSVEMVFELR